MCPPRSTGFRSWRSRTSHQRCGSSSTTSSRSSALTDTDIPATLSVDDVTSWSDEVDVVVLGFGIGGGCAAVSAAAAGARVLVLERAAAAGGTTAMAGGHFYLGGGTAVQEA